VNSIQSQRQEIQQLRSAVVRKKEEKRFEETKEKIEKRPEVRNTSSQTYGRGGSFRRQKRERPAQTSSSTDESSPGCTPRPVRHPGEGEPPGLAR